MTLAHTHTYTCIYILRTINHPKKEILPFVTTWMNLEDTGLSERKQRKTNTV